MAITFKGKPVTIKGNIPAVRDKAPDFTLAAQDLSEVTLASLGRRKKILNVFVSLDTPVCQKSVHAFTKKTASRDDVTVLNISQDLPFAAARFCKAEGLGAAMTLSSFRSSFGEDYGIRIQEGPLKGLLARSVFVLNEDNEIVYREIVPEITHEPDYDKALQASF